MLTIIVATDAQRGIGIHNTLPWRLPEDMAHFKRITSGHPVIMGRKTFDSIGRALPNRRNIVITRNPEWRHDGVESVDSLSAAIALAAASDGPAFIIGGGQIGAGPGRGRQRGGQASKQQHTAQHRGPGRTDNGPEGPEDFAD